MNEERRLDRRFRLKQLFELDFAREKCLNAEVENISKRGILCKTGDFCEAHQRVFAMLVLNEDIVVSTIRFEGIVVHCSKAAEGWETGISITDIPAEDRVILDRFIDAMDESAAVESGK